jgi:hypothetical protein
MNKEPLPRILAFSICWVNLFEMCLMLHTQIAWLPLPLDYCHGCFFSHCLYSKTGVMSADYDIPLDPASGTTPLEWTTLRTWNYDSLPGNLMLLWPLSINNNGSVWPQGTNRGIFQANVLASCEVWPVEASAFKLVLWPLWNLAVVYLPDPATKMNDLLLLTWTHLDDDDAASNIEPNSNWPRLNCFSSPWHHLALPWIDNRPGPEHRRDRFWPGPYDNPWSAKEFSIPQKWLWCV